MTMNASTTPTMNTSAGETSAADDGPSPSTGSTSSSSSAGDADIPPEPERRRDHPAIDVSIDRAVGRRIDAGWLLLHAERVLANLRKCAPAVSFAHVAVSVVDDCRMAELHEQYCGDGTTTDVLTFVVSEANEPIETEIAVCADEAARHAARLGHTVERELLLYILHGLLHCCGYDDHDEADFAHMHELEDAILEAIGIGRTFGVKISRRAAESAQEGEADETADERG